MGIFGHIRRYVVATELGCLVRPNDALRDDSSGGHAHYSLYAEPARIENGSWVLNLVAPRF